jgi:small GTP-binding protein
MSNQKDNLITFKLIVLGESGVGKTAILNRYVKDYFYDIDSYTICVDFYSKQLFKKINNKTREIKLQIWDTAGQERFLTIVKQYFRKSNGAIIVFDLTNSKSFRYAIDTWIPMIRNSEPECEIIVVGNKCDEIHKINRNLIIQECDTKGLTYIEASAKTGENISIIFNKIIDKIIKKNKLDLINNPDIISLIETNNNNNKSYNFKKCCEI